MGVGRLVADEYQAGKDHGRETDSRIRSVDADALRERLRRPGHYAPAWAATRPAERRAPLDRRGS